MSVQVAPPSLVDSNLDSLVTTRPWLGVAKLICETPDSYGAGIVVSVALAPGRVW